ncbi:SusC/RagA family TonB-linked outer membrane protein [Niastella sp. MAH-29]|uniref:SusC/RagA family TonB-linked outer membrane protein n=2 Tax=Chitinophagaceae TaxID=563835 RepID=A0ABS3Z3E9_9BACT|nr:SusC/RagA family TonB-linked outer membrane protein [Niastella soli]
MVCLVVVTKGYSQGQQHAPKKLISAHYDNESLYKVVRDLSNRAGLRFLMDAECSKYTVSVTINKDNATLEEVLDLAFKKQPVNYRLSPAIIMVVPKNVTGRVTDPEGKPIAGVTVAGVIHKCMTNENGEFMLLEATCDPFIEFSCVGFETYLHEQYGDTLVTIKMKINPATQDPVYKVNTGYQYLPKERVTGSFSPITKKQLERQVTTSILDKIEGRGGGVLLNKNRMPGTNLPFIAVRGQSTISANTEPLYVLDNLPYYGNIDNINPNDIESITVLKDAAATSIWGARAGNGVVVLTTKKGSELNKPVLEWNSALTITAKPDLWYLPFPSANDFIEVNKELFDQNYFIERLSSYYALVPPDVEIRQQNKLGNMTDKDMEAQLNTLRAKDVRYDLSRLYQTGVTNRHNLSVTGGTANLKYYLGGGFENENRTQVNSYRQRISLTGNLNFSKKNYELGIQGFFTDTRSKTHPMPDRLYPYSELKNVMGDPNDVPRDLNDQYKDSVKGIVQDWAYRPLQEYNENAAFTKGSHTRLTITGKLQLTSYLTAQLILEHQQGSDELNEVKGSASYYARNLQNKFAVENRGGAEYLIPPGGILDWETNAYTANKARLQLNFEKNKNRNFRILALGGIEVGRFKTDTSVMRYFGYFGDRDRAVAATNFEGSYPLLYDQYTMATVPNLNHMGARFDYFPSAFANGAVTVWRKYTFSVSGRMDQSNLFGVKTNNQTVPLGSVGFKWNVGDETFYPLPFLTNCIIRASYGSSGNVDKSTTAYTSALAAPVNRYGAIPMGIISPDNPFLRWEKSKLFNAGVELSDSRKQLELGFEYYHRKSKFLLGPGAQDPSLGSSFFWGNNAAMDGCGFDASIQTNHSLGRKWRLNNLLLLSKTTNKVIHYDAPVTQAWVYADPKYVTPKEGAPVYSLYAFRWAGLDAVGDPLGYLNGEKNKNYSVLVDTSADNLVRKGSAVPTVFGSWFTSLSYGQFTVSFTLIGKFNYYLRRSSVNYTDPLFVAFAGLNDYSSRWQAGQENNTNVPAVKANNPDRELFYTNAEPLVVKGDQVRLHDVSFQYNMPSPIVKKWKLQAMSFYLYGRNLGPIWKAAPGNIDPDYLTGYPAPRNITVGVKCTF